MPCIQNFQALVSVNGLYLQEFKRRWTTADGSNTTETGPAVAVDSLVESPAGQPFKIMFRAIDPLEQQHDWIVYVLIDGHLCGSRVLVRTDELSSCQISGLSLSVKGHGPVELLDTGDHRNFLSKNVLNVPGSIRVLVYRGVASLTNNPSFFDYPSHICPFSFVWSPDPERCHGLEHVTGFGDPRQYEIQQPDEFFAFKSIDSTNQPWLKVDFFYRSDQQLSEQLAQDLPVVSPPPSAPPVPPTIERPVTGPAKQPIAVPHRVRELGGGMRKDLVPIQIHGAPVYASSVRTKVSPDLSSPLSPSFPPSQPPQPYYPPLSFHHPLSSSILPSISFRPTTSVPLSHIHPATSTQTHTHGLIAPLPVRIRSPFAQKDTNVVARIENEASKGGSSEGRRAARPRRTLAPVKYEEEEDEYVFREVSPKSAARVGGVGRGRGRGEGPVAKRGRRAEVGRGR